MQPGPAPAPAPADTAAPAAEPTPTQPAEDRPRPVEVRLLGPLRVHLDGRQFTKGLRTKAPEAAGLAAGALAARCPTAPTRAWQRRT